MGIFSRLSDIVNSNINSLLDHAEDPEKIIRLMIQEMEETLVEVRSSAARAIAEQKDIARKLTRVDDAQAEWQRKAELALTKGREDLARGALTEKAKLADLAEHLAHEEEALKSALDHYEQDIVKLEAKLTEAKAKKAAIQARHQTASNRLRVRQNIYDGRIDDAFLRFDKVEARLDRMEGEVEAYDLGRGKTLEDEFDELVSNEAIDAELEALKSKVRGAGAPKAGPRPEPGVESGPKVEKD
jgi:phage shock protein A